MPPLRIAEKLEGVTAYTVYEPPNPPSDRLDRAESLVFIKDGFSWGAALFGPLWFLAKRLWLAALLYVVLTLVVTFGLYAIGFSGRALNWMLMAVALIAGFEAPSVQRWTLERRGWSFIGPVVGRSYGECERRFFDAWLPGEPVIASARPQAPTHGTLAAAAGAPVPSRPRRWGRLLGPKS